jgi:DNA-binding SARP family transcriptional activator
MHHYELHVRMLGDFSVLRADGTAVPDSAWRTGKTMDLMRLLALSDGRTVRISTLTSLLWPDVSDERAKGSLRTAASQIRQAVGTNCVERRHDGMALIDAWVDVAAYLAGAHRVHEAWQRQDAGQVLELTREAEDLHVGEFQAHDDASTWAQTERGVIARARHEMLCDAAASALGLGRFREALELASIAVEIEPTSEQAHRLLMTAHAEQGDIGSALRVFERFRARLVEELGADPSSQTQDLHLRLLRGS